MVGQRKEPNFVLWMVGLGCLGLLIFGGLLAGVGTWAFQRATREVPRSSLLAFTEKPPTSDGWREVDFRQQGLRLMLPSRPLPAEGYSQNVDYSFALEEWDEIDSESDLGTVSVRVQRFQPLSRPRNRTAILNAVEAHYDYDGLSLLVIRDLDREVSGRKGLLTVLEGEWDGSPTRISVWSYVKGDWMVMVKHYGVPEDGTQTAKEMDRVLESLSITGPRF